MGPSRPLAPLPTPLRFYSLHDAGVDVAKLLEAEQPGTVGRVIEDEALYAWVRHRSALLAAKHPILQGQLLTVEL